MRAALPFWAWCVVAVFCTALYTASVPVSSSVYEVGLPAAFAIATVQCGALVLAVFRPVVGAALVLASAVVLALVTRETVSSPWPLPVTGLIALGALLLLLGIRERWFVSVIVWWVSVAALVVVIATTPQRYADPDQWGTNLTVYASYTATLLAAAIALGQRRRIRDDLAQAQRDVELEQARRRYVEERARIARELHDVVAHSMSLVHMRALSAPYRLVNATATETALEFDAIARSARGALAEMRQLLGALRSDEDVAELSPQPQVADLDELVATTIQAGLPIDLDVTADVTAIEPIIQLTTYRIVQEALSNVVRHAPGAPTDVRIEVVGEALHVRVHNGSPGTAAAGVGPPLSERGGEGLRGMRERVTLLGGTLTSGPTPDGGFLVDAVLPCPDRTATVSS